jgi:predicted nuclease with TOPRIM domain
MVHSSNTISSELMEILNEISRNVNDVRERLARIEAQDHSDRIETLRAELAQERDKRIALQLEVANVKTRLTPIVVILSMAAASVVQYFFALLSK